MRLMIAAALLTATLCGQAQAQSDDAALTAALNAVVNDVLKIDQSACQGPNIYDSMAAPVGNMAAQIKCQSASMIMAACQSLSGTAGSILQGVQNGETTFDAEHDRLTNETGSNASTGLSGLVIASQAPPGTTPAQLVYETFGTCARMLKGIN